ncbi:hypothetical protein DFR24_1166 [Panacagrimonas perspica]|uniref:Uncharacterized protein n=1 Tax=Panacagrimonas perspica TaxID=381431 RepID=A0A4R7PCE5_9GAMM|nr:hypothetical protein [Panacagrimonas perspica]TDU31784.1 hypothetical protein DFR24_1166 [Panacagrimonas perspica]THD03007.1 hypothetical protein B1810_10420 [Panacagrimonas perspica]
MSILLNVLLYLLLASLVGLIATFMKTPRFGPEGPVGVWLVFVPSLALALLFLAIGSLSGHFAWILDNRFVWLMLSVGILVCLGMALFSLLDRGASRALGIAMSGVVGAACLLSLHPDGGATRRIAALVLFGLPALAGLALLLKALVDTALRRKRRFEADERAFEEARKQRAQWDIDNFATLPVDAPFFAVSQYLWSPTESVQAEARARLAARPDLEAQMIECLGVDGADAAVAGYIAYVEPRPSPTLAPAYAAFLDRQLASWKSTRLIGSNPAQWEPNLSSWFDAAERLQAAGGDLRPSLTAWREALAVIPGFEGLTQRIGQIR